MGGKTSKHGGRDRSRSFKHRIRCHSLPFHSESQRRTGGNTPEFRREVSCLDDAMIKLMNNPPAPSGTDGGKETGHVMMRVEKMDQRQVAVNPRQTPSRAAEVVNVWEVMDGLEDASRLHSAGSSSAVDHLRRYRSLLNPHASGESSLQSPPSPPPRPPTVAEAGAVASHFRLEISSSFGKPICELSPQHQSLPSPYCELLGESSTPPKCSFDSDIDQDFLFAFERALNESSMELLHQSYLLPDYPELLGGVPSLPNSPPVDQNAPYFDPEFLSAFESSRNGNSTPHRSRSPPYSQGVESISLGFDPEILAYFNKTVNETPTPRSSILPLHSPATDANSFDFEPEVLIAFDKAVNAPTLNPSFSSTQHSRADSDALDFDPEILTVFNEILNEPSPPHQSHSSLQPPVTVKNDNKDDDKKPDKGRRRAPDRIGVVEARIKEFQQKINARKNVKKFNRPEVPTSPYRIPSVGDGKVVVYFTSIRGIRKTFEDCLAVRLILKDTGVGVDERDLSMHAGYKEELIALIGRRRGRRSLPRVFADGKYLGGAEEVKSLHDSGRLGEILESCTTESSENSSCEVCSDDRFVICERCFGSCKVGIEEEEEEEEEGELSGIRRCPYCNENGLIRCSLCC